MHRIKIIVVAVIHKNKRSPRHQRHQSRQLPIHTKKMIPCIQCPYKSNLHIIKDISCKELYYEDNIFWDNSTLWNNSKL